jgi:16S rRNA C967 or C1407 C5-methylase (RsmB/RsmF family)/NOL1/NOP2/fmu family ribosome biogenesis protein
VQLPRPLLDSLKETIGFDKEAFEKVHASGEQITSIRINPTKLSMIDGEWSGKGPTHHSPPATHIPWSQYGYYLDFRPSFTFDPLFHAGCYYVQEASSMFLEQALRQTIDLSQPLKILDLSAAPGGKSTHIQSLMSKDSLLVSNEVIRSRANVLKDNIIKWGSENVVVTNNDPRDFARLENYFDVIVVDAPCSGSGLFRRDPEAINEWSLNNVALCSQRQQRILADAWPALKKDGILIYSTCSYSKEENEEILDWMVGQLRVPSSLAMTGYKLQFGEEFGIVETVSASGAVGYRFWPDKVKGEGFFIACFRKEDGEDSERVKARSNATMVSKNELTVIDKWVKTEGLRFIKHENTVYAWPDMLVNDMNFILSDLRVIYSGVRVGELIRDKVVPDHALAMSGLLTNTVVKTELNYEQAIQYLQRKDIQVETKEKGWQLVTYRGHSLGWINALANRINNYYPKELRILKER